MLDQPGSSHAEEANDGPVALELPTYRNGTTPNGSPHRLPDFSPDSQVVIDAGGTRVIVDHPDDPSAQKPKRHLVRWIVVGAIVAAILGAAAYWGVPYLRYELDTVSTDDAFVARATSPTSARGSRTSSPRCWSTRTTASSPARSWCGSTASRSRWPWPRPRRRWRRPGQCRAVAGPGPFADRPAPGGLITAARTRRRRLRRQIATLHAQVAALKSRQSSRSSPRSTSKRVEEPGQAGAQHQEELDQRNNTLKVAIEQEKEAWAAIQETRALLGLPPESSRPARTSPRTWRISSRPSSRPCRDIASSLAEIGIPFDPKDAEQAKAFERLPPPAGGQVGRRGPGEGHRRRPRRSRWRWPPSNEPSTSSTTPGCGSAGPRSAPRSPATSRIARSTPATVSSRARPCSRSGPTYVWIAANYKETQIHDIRIGMPVDLYVDAYPHRVFHGRVAGFSPGTGLSESLLPPENATGNYVKVTQRLPVRIELTEPNPDDTPLFAGLSVVPHVQLKEAADRPRRRRAPARLRPARGLPTSAAGRRVKQPRNRE